MVTLFLFHDHLKVAADDSKICHQTELEALFSEEESKLLGELKETCAVLEAFLGQSGERELQLYGKPKLHYVLTALLCRTDVTAYVLKDSSEAKGTAGTLQVQRRRLLQLWTPPAL
uniref:Uncharacterized protein n=2 Tax=Ixodes ricinus TaxID=34613 RepID=V5I1J6_IXORI